MKENKYFPLGIAKGEAFCNRVNERRRIIENLKAGRHTLVMSPRRYGKSSLVLYALAESKILYERVDLFVAIDSKTIQDQILFGVKQLINKIITAPEAVIKFFRDYFKKLKLKWTINTDGVSIELIPDKDSEPISTIMYSLQALENLLHKKNMQAVFFIDEFQEIGVLANNKGIEGAIRHIAQESRHLNFIFSGSHRHLLSSMFDDRNRPLYMLCNRINLERIDRNAYEIFLNMLSKKQWRLSLDSQVLDLIFAYTERHPYYINVLCGQLWIKFKERPPTVADVLTIWQSYIVQEETKTAKELSEFSTLQKRLLLLIAKGYTRDLSSKAALQQLNVTSAAVVKALQILEEQDYLQRKENSEYFIIDPLVKDSLLWFYK